MPLQIVRKDITAMRVDAIINTTNADMVGYVGIDYAVHKAAGKELDTECAKLAPLGYETVKITKGYKLKAKHIIHTFDPVWQGGLAGESVLPCVCQEKSTPRAQKIIYHLCSKKVCRVTGSTQGSVMDLAHVL